MRPRLTFLLLSATLFFHFGCSPRAEGQRVAKHVQELKQKSAKSDNTALDELIDILNNGNSSQKSFARIHACVAIRDLGKSAKKAIPDLVKALNCGDLYLEPETAKALGPVASAEPEVVEALVKKIEQDDKAGTAWFAADSLAEMGANSERVLSALRIASRSQCQGMALCASEALKKLEKLPKNNGK